MAELTERIQALQPAIFAATILLALLAETFWPVVRRRGRLRHIARNAVVAALAMLCVVAVQLLEPPASEAAQRANVGLLRLFGLEALGLAAVSAVLLDLWFYWLHRLLHAVPWLWRLHRVHHGDAELDCTTAYRFHPIEFVLTELWRLALIPLAGLTWLAIVAYGTMITPMSFLHHLNAPVPERFDRAIRKVFVSPNMHKVHHSRAPQQTDSNFGFVFSIWDRLFGTYREVEDVREVSFGLAELDAPEYRTIRGMLATPFLPVPSATSPASSPEREAA